MEKSTQKPKKNIKKQLLIALPIVVVCVVGVILMLMYFNKPSKITVNNTEINITGVPSITIQISDINSIEMSTESLTFTKRENGTSKGNVRKGKFIVEGYGSMFVSLQDYTSTFIKIVYNTEKYCFINYDNATDTQELYNQIMEYFVR